MTIHHESELVTLHHQPEDGFSVLRSLPDASVDAVVTDPPYGLEFMGKGWDGADGFRRSLNPADVARDNPFGRTSRTSPEYRAGSLFQQWCEVWTAECLRVLKPGGHLLAFGGTRTWHRLACAVEDAGFEVRDSIAWMYGSGFPKSLDVSKAIDKAAGAEREEYPDPKWLDRYPNGNGGNHNRGEGGIYGAAESVLGRPLTTSAPATDAAREWQGWGTALKPAFEPVVVARKPLTGTVAANVLEHGTGALNIDACRIGSEGGGTRCTSRNEAGECAGHPNAMGSVGGGLMRHGADTSGGRWPANVVLDESQAAALDQQSGESKSPAPYVQQTAASGGVYGLGSLDNKAGKVSTHHGDQGGASRFFYVAKAGADERPRVNGTAHPTVKPLALMRWLVRLVTPPGGTVLEPFAGSGTTVEACLLEGFRCIAVEREADYLPLIESRIARRIDPVKAVELAGDDGGLFDLLGEETA